MNREAWEKALEVDNIIQGLCQKLHCQQGEIVQRVTKLRDDVASLEQKRDELMEKLNQQAQ